MEFETRFRNCDFAPEGRCDQGGGCDTCSRVFTDAVWRYTVGYDTQAERCIVFVDVLSRTEDMLTVIDIAEDLGKSKRAIRRYLADGPLEGVKVKGKWRITAEKYGRGKEELQ